MSFTSFLLCLSILFHLFVRLLTVLIVIRLHVAGSQMDCVVKMCECQLDLTLNTLTCQVPQEVFRVILQAPIEGIVIL